MSGRAIAAATTRAGANTTIGGQGERLRALGRGGFLPVAISSGHPSQLEHLRLPKKVERSLQVVEVTQVDIWCLYLRERDQILVGRDAFDERVFEGLIGEVLLGLLGEDEVQELLRFGSVLGAAQDPDSRDVN